MKRKQSGFTLIEIAIVLVIIGLLLGGVLKGQELINSAKVKNLATDFKNIPVFIYGYQDKFKALPGDDASAATHAAGAIACTPAATGRCATGNGVIEGMWNAAAAVTDESALFWQHARLAGLAPGPTALTDAGYIPTNAVGGAIGVQGGTSCTAASTPTASCTAAFLTPVKDASGNALRGAYVVCSRAILGKFAKQLDTTLDDGNTATGSVLVVPDGSAAATSATATGSIDDAASYTVCMGV
ncbi:MAG: prepilin-type N-terminal cleavage/methylation domain-containing protein [Gallionellaceae bacterium]|nr:MAG: prepilin-type N-terminal cleavage/methylation domain-containing protein [Gallionellaceae bacterium]